MASMSTITSFLKNNKDNIGIGVTAASGLFGAFSNISAGNRLAKDFLFKSAISKANSNRVAQVMDEVRESGKDQDQLLSEAGAKTIADQIAAFAGRGVVVGDGVVNDVTEDTARTISLDRAALEDEIRRTIVGLDFQRRNLLDLAAQDKRNASSAKRSGFLGAAGTLLSTAGTISSKWG